MDYKEGEDKMFEKVLRSVRKIHKDSLRSLGDKASITFTYINKVEKKENPPSKNFIRKIIKVYPEDKKILLESYVKDLLPEGESIEIFRENITKIEKIEHKLFERLTKEQKKLVLNDLLDKVELTSYREGKHLQEQKEIERMKNYINEF